MEEKNEILYIGTDNELSKYLIGTENGFAVYDPLKFEIIDNNLGLNGGISFLQFVYFSQDKEAIALVGGGSTPYLPTNVVSIYEMNYSTEAQKHMFGSRNLISSQDPLMQIRCSHDIVNLKSKPGLLVIFTENSVKVFSTLEKYNIFEVVDIPSNYNFSGIGD